MIDQKKLTIQTRRNLRKLGKKQASKAAGVYAINFEDGFAKGKLDRRSYDNTFGRSVMYDDDIQAKLFRLETCVSGIVYAINDDLSRGQPVTIISKAQHIVLRNSFSLWLTAIGTQPISKDVTGPMNMIC